MLELRTSADGSLTLYSSQFDETYHSIHGALNESQHVFIRHGLEYIWEKGLTPEIFEVGFGTGLNCFLSLSLAAEKKKKISYTSIEAFPIEQELWSKLEYPQNPEEVLLFEKVHLADWNCQIETSDYKLLKIHQKLEDYKPSGKFNLIYFDAFSPGSQPELWQPEIFSVLFEMMESEGALVTYCAKGQFKRDLRACGFMVESLPGPSKKKEITRAIKP